MHAALKVTKDWCIQGHAVIDQIDPDWRISDGCLAGRRPGRCELKEEVKTSRVMRGNRQKGIIYSIWTRVWGKRIPGL
jgi:hypothetical protein